MALETPSLPQGDWGQGAANNTIGWGQGACNGAPWGDIHRLSYGHAITNLAPCGFEPEPDWEVWFPTNNLQDNSTSDLYSANGVNFLKARIDSIEVAVAGIDVGADFFVDYIIHSQTDRVHVLSNRASGFYTIYQNLDGSVHFRAGATGGLETAAGVGVVNTMMRVERTNGFVNFYRDGVLIESIAQGTQVGTFSPNTIGRWNSATTVKSSSGTIAYVNYNGINAWKFTEGNGEVVYDSIGTVNGKFATELVNPTDLPQWETGLDTTIFTPNLGDPAVYARSFDGVLDEINFGGGGANLIGKTVSISMTVEDYTTSQMAYQYSTGAAERFGIGISASSIGVILNSGVAAYFTLTFAELDIDTNIAGQKVEIVAVITDYTSAVVTINGITTTGNDVVGGPDSSGHLLGNRAGNDRPFLGKVISVTNSGFILNEENNWTNGVWSPTYTGTLQVQSGDYATAVEYERPPTWVQSNGPNAASRINRVNLISLDLDVGLCAVDVNITGDCYIEFITSNLSGTIRVVGFSSNIHHITLAGTTTVNWNINNNNTAFTNGGNFIDGATYKVERVGLVGNLYENGILQDSQAVVADAIIYDRINQRGTTVSATDVGYLYVDINGQAQYDFTNTDFGTLTVADQIGSNDITLSGYGTWEASFDGGATWSTFVATTSTNVITQTAIMGFNNYDFFDRATPIGFEKNGSTLPINGATFVIDFVTLQTTDTQIIYDISNTTDVLALRVMIVAGDLILQIKDAFEIVNFWNLVATIAANVNYTLTIVVSGGLITSADLSGTPLIDQGVGASQSYPGVDSIAYGQEVAFGGSDHFNGVIFNVNTGGVDYNYSDSWDGATPFLGVRPQKMVVPAFGSNDILGFNVYRKALSQGYNWSGQVDHHLDTLTMLTRNATGISGAEVNTAAAGPSAFVPATPFVAGPSAAAFIEFRVYSTGSPFVMGKTVSTSSYIQLTATTVLWRFGGQTVSTFNTDVDPRGQVVRLERDAGGGDARLLVNGITKDTILTAPTNQFAPDQLGASLGVGAEAQFDFFDWNNGENTYVFNAREGSIVKDFVGTNNLTFTDLGNGLPTWVKSTDAGVNWVFDDFQEGDTADYLNGTTDAYWISVKDAEQIQDIAGDDVYFNQRIDDNFARVTFNAGILDTKSAVISTDLPVWIAFVQDGNGTGVMYFAGFGGPVTAVAIGAIGLLQATAANMFYGNGEGLGTAFNGYMTQMIAYNRQIPPNGLEFLRTITQENIPVALAVNKY